MTLIIVNPSVRPEVNPEAVQYVHDVFETLLNEVDPNPVQPSDEDRTFYILAQLHGIANFTCWLLGHKNNPAFGNNLDELCAAFNLPTWDFVREVSKRSSGPEEG